MQAKIMVPMLLIAIAGCARSADAPAPAAPGSAGQVVPATAGQATAAEPAPSSAPVGVPPAQPRQPQPQTRSPGQAPGAPAAGSAGSSGSSGSGGSQGIRVGEPSPYGRGGPQNPAPGTGWHAFGNEPFWSVQARGGTLVFATPDNQGGVTLLGRRVPSLVGTVILGSGPRGDFHFGVTPGKCSDGMSDRTHAYTSTFIYDGVTYKGCAEPVEAR
jgi:uncharacterized membrane protein